MCSSFNMTFANLVNFAFMLLLQLYVSNIAGAYPYPADASGAVADHVGTGRPRLKSFHFDSNLIDGKSVRVFCQLSEGALPASFKWLKDGLPLTSAQASSASSNGASPSHSHISIETFQDYSSLAINRVDRHHDNGNYTCRVQNSYGTDQYSSLLTVQEPPHFQEKPTDISIGLGKSKVIICRATASYTIPEIRWNRILTGFTTVGLPLGKDARREHIATGEQLHLNDVREQDAGVYECVADPHNDLAISHTFTVTVNVPASFESRSDMLEVKRGETAKLVCEAHGAKPVSVKWLRQDIRSGKYKEIDLDFVPDSFTFPRYTALEKNFDSNHDGRGGSGSESATGGGHLHKPHHGWPYVNNNRTLFELHINSVNSMDNGRYECRIFNAFGEDAKRIDLFVQDVPAAVRDVHINHIWSRDVSLSWLAPEMNGNSAIIQYVVQYWKELRSINQSEPASQASFGGGHRLHEIEVSPTETQCTIKNLTPGTSYVIRVIAVNNLGRGPMSASVRVLTVQEAPSAAPIDITAESQSTTSLRIRWKAPPKSHWNGQLRGYYLGYRLLAYSDTDNSENSVNGDTNANSDSSGKDTHLYSYKELPFNGAQMDNYQEEYILTGLNRASMYSIIIKCFNGGGEGPDSQEIIAQTAVNEPPPKPKLWVSETNENSVVLKWEQKESSTEVTHYVFFYKEEKKPWMEITYPRVATVDGNGETNDSYELTGLQRGTVYQIYMRTMGDKSAMSEPSDVITVRTEGEISLMSIDSSAQTYPVAPIPTIYSQPANQHHILLTPSPTFPYQQSSQQNVPPYLRLAFILPVMIAVVVIVIACVSAYVYIRIDDRKAQMKAYKTATAAANGGIYAGTVSVAPGKRFQYFSGVTSMPSTSGGAGPSNFPVTSSYNMGQHNSGAESCTQSLVSEEGSLSFRYSDSDKNRPLLAASRPSGQGAVPTGVMWAQQQLPIMEEDEAIIEIDSSAYETLPFQKNNDSLQPMRSFNGGTSMLPGMKLAQQQHTTSSNHSSNSSKSAKSPAFPPPPPPLPGAMPSSKTPLNKMSGVNNVFCHADVHHVQSSSASDANNSDSYDEFHFFAPGGPQHV